MKGIRSIIVIFLLVAPMAVMALDGDDFNDNVKNASKWGADEVIGLGVLTEKNQRLEYTCNIGTSDDDATRPWVLTRFPYNANWEMKLDVVNLTSLSGDDQNNSFGIMIRSPRSAENDIYAEMYSSRLGGPPERNGFHSALHTNGTWVAMADTGELVVTHGAVRMTFDSGTKVIRVFYAINPTDPYQWTEYGSFGLAGAGGDTGNTDWGLTDTDQFPIFVYGYSTRMTITSGQMFGDNFTVTGGVPPVGDVAGPTGSFRFAFPIGNPLAIAIAYLTGNYEGVSPTQHQRNYNIDVAQDESGKLSAMGTVDGILTQEGSPGLSAGIGAVTTVNDQPTVQLKGSFTGTRDGVTASISGTVSGPLEVTDIGGGTPGVSGTATYKGKVGGVPFGDSNVPLRVAAPPGSVENLKKNWSLQLDIQGKVNSKGKTYIAASSQLVLPSGDTIVFPERATRYSAKTGYSLSFRQGTNITMHPPKVDKKTSILIKGLTFTKQGTNWQPTGGAITYQFLGQKGSGNLVDFIVPPLGLVSR